MKSTSTLLSVCFALYLITPSFAEKGPVFLDAKSAGPEYALQGEYKGLVDIGGGEEEFGVQIVALGDGKFKLVAFQGGLPGDGWDLDNQQMEGEGVVGQWQD